jgi:hypothetical protein
MFTTLTRFSISNVFLFYSTPLPAFDTYPFSLNCLQLIDSSPFDSAPPATVHGATHCFLSSCRPELTGYLFRLVTDVVRDPVRLSVRVSQGIEVVWVCGNKNERQVHCRDMEFEFVQFPSTLAVTFAVQPAPDFSDHETFSVQAVASFGAASTIVHNRVWRKAVSTAEWCDAIDVAVMAAVFIRQHAAHILVPRFLERPYSWEIAGLPRDHGRAAAVAAVVRLFRELFVAEASVLPGAIRAAVLRLVMAGGPAYAAALVGALAAPAAEPPLVIPPFVLLPEGQAAEIAVRVRDPCGMVPVVVQIAARAFGALEKQLRRAAG